MLTLTVEYWELSKSTGSLVNGGHRSGRDSGDRSGRESGSPLVICLEETVEEIVLSEISERWIKTFRGIM